MSQSSADTIYTYTYKYIYIYIYINIAYMKSPRHMSIGNYIIVPFACTPFICSLVIKQGRFRVAAYIYQAIISYMDTLLPVFETHNRVQPYAYLPSIMYWNTAISPALK